MSVRDDLLQAARAVIESVGLRADESCLVLTDPPRENIGRALWEAAREVTPDVLYVAMPESSRDGEEPPGPVADLMLQAAVILAPTTYSLSHTAARRAACSAGARVATLPGIRETTMVRCFGPDVDVQAIHDRTERVAARLRGACSLRAWTDAGTDLSFDILGGSVNACTGFVREPGVFDNLPSGEAFLRPSPGTAQGRIVVDGSMAGIGDLSETEPIVLDVVAGRVVGVTGGDMAAALDRLLAEVGDGAYHFAEFGVGTNDAARVVGCVLEDEKSLGTIYVGIGSDVSAGGSVDVPVHVDGVILRPNVSLDGEPLLQDGELVG